MGQVNPCPSETCGAYFRHPCQLHLMHIHLRHPSIRVMETAQYRQGHDLARGAKRCCAYFRHPISLPLAHSQLRCSSILVMEATENWEGDDFATVTVVN